MKTAILFILTLSSLKGWALGCKNFLTKEEGKWATSQRADETPSPPTLSRWRKLSKEAKIEKLYQSQIRSITLFYTEITNTRLRQVIDKMAQRVLEEVGRDNIDNTVGEGRFTVGEPHPESVGLFKIDGTLVAIGLNMIQEGGETRSLRPTGKDHYATHDEAKAALGKDYEPNADVSWSVHSYFELDGWRWKELDLDIFDEGGFSWSGY
ncbi:MAG: hypothetical protein OXB88_08620 [Bacteriovoracales bacterium]|nr:hypothetical protein [Bacteriovoracales bacterium]